MSEDHRVDPPAAHRDDRCWLTHPVKDDRPRVGSSSVTRSSSGACSITVANLTRAELEAMESFLCGCSYLRVVDGRLSAYHVYEPLPDAESDPIVGPHWEGGTVREFGGVPAGEGWHLPGITIEALGAGSLGNSERKRSQEMVIDCGFECLRSRRDGSGRLSELWVLSSLTFARGRLAAHLETWRGKGKPHWHRDVEEACRFIAQDLRVRFGSMDITIQRWALCNSD